MQKRTSAESSATPPPDHHHNRARHNSAPSPLGTSNAVFGDDDQRPHERRSSLPHNANTPLIMIHNPLHRLSVSSTTTQGGPEPPVRQWALHSVCMHKRIHPQTTQTPQSPSSSFTTTSSARQVLFALPDPDDQPLLPTRRSSLVSGSRPTPTNNTRRTSALVEKSDPLGARASSNSSQRSSTTRLHQPSFRPNLAAVTKAQQRVAKKRPGSVGSIPSHFPPPPITTLGLFDSSRSLTMVNASAQWRATLSGWLESTHLVVFVGVCTLVSLFLSDVHAVLVHVDADDALEAVAMVLVAVLLGELLLSALVHPTLCWRVHFWFDLAGTLALVLHLPIVVAGVTGRPWGVQDALSIVLRLPQPTSTTALHALYAAQRLRLFCILRLYRQTLRFHTLRAAQHVQGTAAIQAHSPLDQQHAGRETRVGQKLSRLITRNVIIMALTLVVGVPVFRVLSGGMYAARNVVHAEGLRLAATLYVQQGQQISAVVDAALEHYTSLETLEVGHVLALFLCGQLIVSPRPSLLQRASEILWVGPPAGSVPHECRGTTMAVVDVQRQTRLVAGLQIAETLFVLMVFGVAALVFHRDSTRLVLRPLARMMAMVKDVSNNPLGRQSYAPLQLADKDHLYEPRILEHCIGKLCNLVAVGFGDAGAEIIADNIRSTQELDPMIPGKRVHAIFAFCDVRHFTAVTEVLQEQIMEFVNNIARIVHLEVTLHGGFPNKNVGDAFLLVWKLPSMPGERGSSSGMRPAPTTEHRARMHDRRHPPSLQEVLDKFGILTEGQLQAQALATTARQRPLVQGGGGVHGGEFQASWENNLERCGGCGRHAKQAGLQAKLPGFQVQMGFGLHVGWGIEGAIGSEYKIDPSYLSPNVNMASRLESATKQFGTSVLLSDTFVACLSPAVRTLVREIDRVVVKGASTPISLYSYDLTLERLQEDDVFLFATAPLTKNTADTAGPSKRSEGILGRKGRDMTYTYREDTDDADQPTPQHDPLSNPSNPDPADIDEILTYSTMFYKDEFQEHPDIVNTVAVDAAFRARFAVGYTAYVQGEWAVAREVLNETLGMRRNAKGTEVVRDGPSAALLEYMEGFGFVAPAGWPGYRVLEGK